MTDPSTTATIPEGSNTTGALIAFGVIMAVIALVIVVMVTAVIGSTLSKGKKHKPLQSSISDDDTETPYNRGICIHVARVLYIV